MNVCALLSAFDGGPLRGSASPLARGSRCLTADLVQDAALDTDTVARVTTKLYSAARPLSAAVHLVIDPFPTSWGRVSKPYYKMRAP